MHMPLSCIFMAFALVIAQLASAAGPWRAGESNTRGWELMTAEERLTHQAKIRAFERYEDCRAYQVEHHRAMQERAKQLGRTLGAERQDFCAHLQAAGKAR